MTRTNRGTTQANYDKLSRWYDWLAGSGEERAQQAALALLNAQPGERVLEIGFGAGRTLLALAQAVQLGGIVVSVDLSGRMCDIALDKLKQAALKNSHPCQGDVVNLPFRGHSFDAMLMSITLELFTPQETPIVLQMCRRMLRENGRLCITAMSNQGKQGLMMHVYQWANHQFPFIVDCRPIDLHQLLREANFTILKTHHLSMWGLPVIIVLAQPS